MKYSSTLQIKLPLGQTLICAIGLLLGIGGLLELLARQEFVQVRLPAPSFGSTNPYFNQKLQLLEKFAAQQGKVDCVFLGTSTGMAGLDPLIVNLAFKNKSGERLDCFNLAMPGMFAATAAKVATVINRRYHPQLFIYATDATGYYHNTLDGISDSPWLQYWLGEWTVRGWVLEHSYLYRHYVAYKTQQLAYYRLVASQIRTTIRADGFETNSAPISQPGLDFDQPPDPQAESVWFDVFAHPETVAGELQGLAEFAKVKEAGPTVLFIQMPLHPTAQSYFASDDTAQPRLSTQIAQIASAGSIPFWKSESQPAVPPNAWYDRVHLNRIGADLISAWLGQRLAEAVRAGELADPTFSK